MFSRIIAFLCLISFLSLPQVSYSQEKVTPVNKGQITPYTGMLMSPEAVAKVLADMQIAPEVTDAEVTKAVAEQKAQDQLEMDRLLAEVQYQKSVGEAQVKSRDTQIAALQKQLQTIEKNKPNVAIWASLGAVGGIAITLLTVFAVSRTTR